MPTMIDHVALLVPRLEPALAGARALGLEVGPIEAFPGEGTREAYCGPADAGARLLLLEAAGPGPYARALVRRGPGLHHVAVGVADGPAFAAASGWLLHPRTLTTQPRTLWLARPGVGTLIEVMHGVSAGGEAPVVEAIEVAGPATLLAPLGLTPSADGAAWLRIGGRRVAARGGLEALA